MTDIRYIQSTERQVGESHPTLDDTLNRALRDVLEASGLDPDADFTGFVARSATDEFYVESYRLNGAVSDTVAYQAALNAAKANGRGTVVLGARDYSITGVSLTSATDITIRGQGRKATKISMSGSTNGALHTFTLCERFRITDLWMHGNNVGTTDGASGCAIYWDMTGAVADMDGFELDHCTLDNFKGASWVRVQNTTAYTCQRGWWHHNVAFGGSDQDPTDIGTASSMFALRLPSGAGNIADWWIEENVCEASSVKQGIYAVGTGTGKFKRIVYRNNTVLNAGVTNLATVKAAYGLILYGTSEDCLITGNQAISCVTAGIYTNLSRRCRVLGNTVTGSVDTDDSTLSRGGIAMTDPFQMVVANNNLYGNTLCGIAVAIGSATDAAGTVTDNVIEGGTFGVIVRGGTASNIVGLAVDENTIYGQSDYAINMKRAASTGELADSSFSNNRIGYPSTAVLNIGTTDTKVSNSAVTYTLSGTLYRLPANIAGTSLAAGTIPADQFGIYLYSVDNAQALTCTPGAANFTTGYASAALALAALPSTPANQFSLGYVIVQTAAGQTFIGGTDSLTGGASGHVALSTVYAGFSGTAGNGIGSTFAQNLRNVRVANNIINATGTIGIQLDAAGFTADGVVVENNIIDGPTTYGLALSGGTWSQSRCVNNVVRNAGTNGDTAKGCYRITTAFIGEVRGNVGFPVSGGSVTVASTRTVWESVKAISSTPYTVLPEDDVLIVDCTSAGITINMPAVASYQGKRLTVIKSDSSANTVTIARAGSDTINNQTSATLTNRYQSMQLTAQGTAWFMTASGIVSTAGAAQVATTPTANTNSTIVATTAYVDRGTTHSGTTSAAPTGTTSATAVMMGLAGSVTPTRGTKIIVMASGQLANNTINDGATVDLRFGTGSAPTNGAAVTGTLIGIAQTETSLVAGSRSGFCVMGKVTGLTVGTAYWLDLSLLAVTGGTATVTGVSIVAFEVP